MERAGEAEDAAAEHGDPRPSGLTPSVQAAAEVDWEAVREAYELSDESVSAIEKRFGLTKHQLTRARLTGRWTTRPPVAKRKPILPRRRAVGTDIIAYRLNKLLVVGMALLETRLAEEGMTDQNARVLTELCRAEEIRMRSTRTKTAKTRETKKTDAGYDFRADPAWLDAEFARRIGQLGSETGGRGEVGEGVVGGETGDPGGLDDMGAA